MAEAKRREAWTLAAVIRWQIFHTAASEPEPLAKFLPPEFRPPEPKRRRHGRKATQRILAQVFSPTATSPAP
jgi:hypothetical protein